MAKEQEGPKVRLSTSCFGCKHEESVRDECQGDVSWDNYCTHPSFDERKYIGDNGASTPDFCPFKKEAVSRALANFC